MFASQGKHAAPSLSSGGVCCAILFMSADIDTGDLDGDKYTVIWDSELIPTKVSQVCSMLSYFTQHSILHSLSPIIILR